MRKKSNALTAVLISLCVIISLLIPMTALAASSSKDDEANKLETEAFFEALLEGIEARNKMLHDTDYESEDDYYYVLKDALIKESEYVVKYEEAEFVDPALARIAKLYFAGRNAMIIAIEDYDDNRIFSPMLYTGYSMYNQSLIIMSEDFGLELEEEDLDTAEESLTLFDNILDLETDGSPAAHHSVSEDNVYDIDEEIELIADYTLPDGLGWYTRHFMIIKNNSDHDIDVSTQSFIYDKDDEMIGFGESSYEALGPDCTTVVYESVELEDEVAYYECSISAKNSKYYRSAIQYLSYEKNDIKGGAVFKVTNNGDEAIPYLQGYVLFFLDDELVDYDYEYFMDDDDELKPGDTVTKQIKSYEDFDRIEMYFNGQFR